MSGIQAWDDTPSMEAQFGEQAANPLTEAERELKRLRELEWILLHAGIIEIAVRNPNVAEYMRHWEGRAEKAEARAALEDTRHAD